MPDMGVLKLHMLVVSALEYRIIVSCVYLGKQKMFSVIACTDTEVVYTCRSCSCLCYHSILKAEPLGCSPGYFINTCLKYLCCRCLGAEYKLSKLCLFCRVRDGKKNG